MIARSVFLIAAFSTSVVFAGSAPVVARNGMVVAQDRIASDVGAEVLKSGGSAIDAAVATGFALAVVHPAAGNVGGGGFLIYRPVSGEPIAYDFRETAPAAATPDMWLVDGKYDYKRHHDSHLAVGVPGTVAGLYLAWLDHGRLPWRRLVDPAIRLAREGFTVTHELARSLQRTLPRLSAYPASVEAFTKSGEPYVAGDVLRQPDLAETLERIAEHGAAGFYTGKTAELIVQEMEAGEGLITLADLHSYTARRRKPILGKYRGYEVISMPPPSSGGTAIVQMLNMLEGYDLAADEFGSAVNFHRYAEAMRRAFADRAQWLGDPESNPSMPIARLTSKVYANHLRGSIDDDRASKSAPQRFHWDRPGKQTTHLSVVDKDRNAVSLTYTLERAYGAAIVVPGAGFLLNNEMGDFNAAPGLTNDKGLIGTEPNVAGPGKRMLSSMSPTILTKDGELFMVTGSPGGRTIINTVLQTIVNVVDHGMNAQEAVDAGRIHHQWLPDRIVAEPHAISPDTREILRGYGHQVVEISRQGSAQIIVVDQEQDLLQGGSDRRTGDAGAVGY